MSNGLTKPAPKGFIKLPIGGEMTRVNILNISAYTPQGRTEDGTPVSIIILNTEWDTGQRQESEIIGGNGGEPITHRTVAVPISCEDIDELIAAAQ